MGESPCSAHGLHLPLGVTRRRGEWSADSSRQQPTGPSAGEGKPWDGYMRADALRWTVPEELQRDPRGEPRRPALSTIDAFVAFATFSCNTALALDRPWPPDSRNNRTRSADVGSFCAPGRRERYGQGRRQGAHGASSSTGEAAPLPPLTAGDPNTPLPPPCWGGGTSAGTAASASRRPRAGCHAAVRQAPMRQARPR